MANPQQPEADYTYKRLTKSGMSHDEAKGQVMRMYGTAPSIDAVAAQTEGLTGPAEVEAWQAEQQNIAIDKASLDDRVARETAGLPTPRAVNDVFDAVSLTGSVPTSTISQKTEDIKWAAARFGNRASNLAEITLGRAAFWASRPQQVLFGALSGEGWGAFRRFSPTFAKSKEQIYLEAKELMDHETLSQMEALAIVGEEELFSTNMLNQEYLDREPWIMERMDADLKFQDVLFKWLPQDKVDEFLVNHKTTGMVAGTVIGTLGDFFADPMWLVGKIAKPIGAMKYFPQELGKVRQVAPEMGKVKQVVEATKAAQLEGSFVHETNKLMMARRSAGKRVEKLMKKVESDPKDAEALRHLDNAQRQYMELDTAVRASIPDNVDVKTARSVVERLGPKADAELGPELGRVLTDNAPIHRNPETVFNAADSPAGPTLRTGKPVEDLRREAMARGYAEPKLVEDTLKAKGFPGGLREFKARMTAANEAVKKDIFNAPQDVYDTLNAYEKLPKNVKDHLHALGWSRERIFRQNALRQPTLELKGGFELNAAAKEQLALLGPSDAVETADAARRLALGASPEDLLVHGALLPEHELARFAPLADWADGKWLTESADDIRRVRLKNGQWITPDKVQRTMRYGRSLPSLFPGSRLPKVAEIVTGKSAFVRGHRDFLNGYRQPQNAYGNKYSYKVIRHAQGDFHGKVLRDEHWYGDMLKTRGWGKLNREGRLVYKGEGKKNMQYVFSKLLDAKDDLSFEKALRMATKDQKEVFWKLRAWFDQAARDLKIPEGMYIRHYAPHMFPWEDMKAGARIPEFASLPITGKVGFKHLLARKGADGYTDDMNLIFQTYARGRWRKQIMEPAYEEMLKHANDLRKTGTAGMKGQHKLGAFHSQANYIEDLVAEAKGYPSALEKILERDMQAAAPKVNWRALVPSQRTAARFAAMHYVSMLAGRSNYFLRNLGSAAVSYLAQFGPMRTARGMLATLDPGPMGQKLRKMTEESGATGHAIAVMDELEQTAGGAYARWMKRMGNAGHIEASENQIRAMGWHASMGEQLNQLGMSWDDAEKAGILPRLAAQAVEDVEFSQHVYGLLGRSPKFARFLGKGYTQNILFFKSWPYKHGEMLVSMFNKNPGIFARYMAYSGWLTRVAATAGIDIAQSVGLSTLAPGERQGSSYMDPAAPIQTLLAIGKSSITLWDTMRGASSTKQWEETLDEVMAAGKNVVYGAALIDADKRRDDFAKGARRDWRGGVERRFEEGIITDKGELNQDFIPALIGAASVKDSQKRQEDLQLKQDLEERMSLLNRYSRLILRAYDKNDKAEVQRLSKEAIEKWGISAHNGIVRSEHAARLEAQTRDVLNNLKRMPPSVIRRQLEREMEFQRKKEQEGQ